MFVLNYIDKDDNTEIFQNWVYGVIWGHILFFMYVEGDRDIVVSRRQNFVLQQGLLFLKNQHLKTPKYAMSGF